MVESSRADKEKAAFNEVRMRVRMRVHMHMHMHMHMRMHTCTAHAHVHACACTCTHSRTCMRMCSAHALHALCYAVTCHSPGGAVDRRAGCGLGYGPRRRQVRTRGALLRTQVSAAPASAHSDAGPSTDTPPCTPNPSQVSLVPSTPSPPPASSGKLLSCEWELDVCKWVTAAGGTEEDGHALFQAFQKMFKEAKKAQKSARPKQQVEPRIVEPCVVGGDFMAD